MTEELAIVIGTSNTSIYLPGNGIVLHEPTMVAYNGDSKLGKVRAVGKTASFMSGRITENTTLSYPVTGGFISDPDACRDMLTEFLKKLFRPRLFAPKFKAIVGVPIGLTIEERRFYDDVFSKSGINEIIAIENIVLSAIGIDLPVHSHKVNLIVNVGGGITEIAAISSSGIIKGCNLSIGGNLMDKAFRDYLLGKYNLKLGMSSIAKAKEEIGSLYANDTASMWVNGMDLNVHAPSGLNVKATDFMDALMPYYLRIADGIDSVIKSLSIESGADLTSGGVHIVGGGSKIPGLAKLLAERLNMLVTVHPDAEYANVFGGGKLLSNPVLLNEILTQR
ncbi:MAG: rod shape-determining protein [Clostridia bacterium]|nr:rod shape-determining protein [Clostridia bacterium]